MVLRLVIGPMLEKSNKTGPLADQQKALQTARFIEFPFFLDFQLPGKRKISIKFSGIPENSLRDSQNLGSFREIFAGNFFELDYFVIFSDLQHSRFNF